jgi:hypothetical protein
MNVQLNKLSPIEQWAIVRAVDRLVGGYGKEKDCVQGELTKAARTHKLVLLRVFYELGPAGPWTFTVFDDRVEFYFEQAQHPTAFRRHDGTIEDITFVIANVHGQVTRREELRSLAARTVREFETRATEELYGKMLRRASYGKFGDSVRDVPSMYPNTMNKKPRKR